MPELVFERKCPEVLFVADTDERGALRCPHCGLYTGMPLSRLIMPDETGECVICTGTYAVHTLTALRANAKRMASGYFGAIALHSLIFQGV